jgi:hypothetical protein
LPPADSFSLDNPANSPWSANPIQINSTSAAILAGPGSFGEFRTEPLGDFLPFWQGGVRSASLCRPIDRLDERPEMVCLLALILTNIPSLDAFVLGSNLATMVAVVKPTEVSRRAGGLRRASLGFTHPTKQPYMAQTS